MPSVFRSRVALLGLAIAVAACGFNSTMERAVPVESYCSLETRPPAVSAPPDTTELRWYRAAQERDVELSSRWCATVGEPVFRPDPASGFPDWTQGRELEAFTWNVDVGGGDLFAFLRSETGLDCSDPARAVASGPGPLVLLVQEAWRRSDELPVVESSSDVPWTVDPDRGPDGGADIVEVAERCGLALLYVPSARNGPDSGDRPREDKGNAILSSIPLTAPIAFDLPFEAGRKVAVAATVRAPGGERVRIVSAHFDVASTLTRTLLSGNQTRARQADGLIEGLRRAEDEGPLNGVTLLGGDFNTWSARETALKRMRASFPDSPEWDGESTWRPLGLPVDHFFFRRGPFDNVSVSEYARLETDYGSDHFGRRIVVEYAPSAVPD
ncbi:MAG: hypothetical protein HKN72_03820 [Gemmatimonadetes bacterium]|nr:endonuclease/exonuclease/phosphatase family protein [Gemmatimonadota bacterium]NNF12321.1 hypothetical protein [Gemmatimonadota bacterium]NNL30552.1 hypothetical protein [Gemmatimonadota bacterium]